MHTIERCIFTYYAQCHELMYFQILKLFTYSSELLVPFFPLQWYTMTLSGPKVASLIVHVTEMGNLQAMTRAAHLFLMTLNPTDHVAVYFNSSLYMNSFVQASTENIQKIEQFINPLNAGGLKHMPANHAFRVVFEAFYALHDKQMLAMGTTCSNNIALFLCDSSLPGDHDLIDEIRDMQNVSRMDIFTYTFNQPFVDPTVHQDIACTFGGAWFGTEIFDTPIDDVIPSYLSFYSGNLSRSEVTWSGINEDVLSQKSIFTGCLPIYQNKSEVDDLVDMLIGVVCIDIDADRFQELEGGNSVSESVTSSTDT